MGFFFGHKVVMNSLGEWVLEHWFPMLAHNPTFDVLRKGWVGFIINAKEDAKKILASCSTL